jgi:hypothetical protein
MENGQLPDDKLFRAVHDRLSDYEAPANGADWDAMSRSLDSLPKTARFQWRISLNSILVILGVTGLSVIGYAVVTHTGHSGSKQPLQQVATQTTTPQPQVTSVALNTMNQTPNTTSAFDTHQGSDFSAVANTTPAIADNSQMGLTSNVNTDGLDPNAKTKKKKRDNNGLFFGDQIDPKKGFIYNTHEDQSVLTPVPTISNPNEYYDLDNNGQIRKIIHKDSSATVKKEKTFVPDSTANNSPFAPVDGGQKGFDPEAQR